MLLGTREASRCGHLTAAHRASESRELRSGKAREAEWTAAKSFLLGATRPPPARLNGAGHHRLTWGRAEFAHAFRVTLSKWVRSASLFRSAGGEQAGQWLPVPVTARTETSSSLAFLPGSVRLSQTGLWRLDCPEGPEVLKWQTGSDICTPGALAAVIPERRDEQGWPRLASAEASSEALGRADGSGPPFPLRGKALVCRGVRRVCGPGSSICTLRSPRCAAPAPVGSASLLGSPHFTRPWLLSFIHGLVLPLRLPRGWGVSLPGSVAPSPRPRP